MNAWSQKISRAIRQQALFHDRERIVVAVSGGADSVVLLHALCAEAALHGWRLSLAHYNHRLRGAESDADEAFACALAKRLNLPCFHEAGDVAGHARTQKLSLEMAARQCRHKFLVRAARHGKSKVIALAHHADDQLELFFLRLLRGTSGEGLAGMKWSNPSPHDPHIRLTRPLLALTRGEVLDYAGAEGLKYRYDRSNDCLDMQRNWIRKKLLPLLLRRQPGAPKTVARLMEIAGSESDFVAQAAGQIQQAGFAAGHTALQRKLLQTRLLNLGQEPDFDLIEQLRLHPGTPVACRGGLWLERTEAGSLRRVQPLALFPHSGSLRVPLSGGAGRVIWEGVRFGWRIQRAKTGERPRFGPGREFFDATKIGDCIQLRHWQPGDRMQPIGLAAAAKLQDLFTNQKVPAGRRRELAVATTAAGEIFWVEGLRISERFKLDNTSARVLEWRWRRVL